MKIRLAGVVNDSIVDGPGFRLTVFVQGCSHHCPGCHNPETHDPNGGHWGDTAEIVRMAEENPLLDGITLSGGEPFEQPEACRTIAAEAHRLGLTVWAFTGYCYEMLVNGTEAQKALLGCIDCLVDGPFRMAERTLSMRFRGSKNQRIIDVPRSLAAGMVVLSSYN